MDIKISGEVFGLAHFWHKLGGFFGGNLGGKNFVNGKSANISELSCEMAVTSDTSEKVHGNIPHLAPKISSACRPSELYARPT